MKTSVKSQEKNWIGLKKAMVMTGENAETLIDKYESKKCGRGFQINLSTNNEAEILKKRIKELEEENRELWKKNEKLQEKLNKSMMTKEEAREKIEDLEVGRIKQQYKTPFAKISFGGNKAASNKVFGSLLKAMSFG